MPLEWLPLDFVYDEADEDEPMGSKEKWWVELLGDDRPWLLKLARLDLRDGTVSGEDWAEWLAHHLYGQLGIPSATIRPARLEVRRGIVSRSVLGDRSEYLDHGNSVLAARFPEYDQAIEGENPGYTPEAVRAALSGIGPPRDVQWPAEFTAFDVWAGYLMMDAWTAGRDRHQENWAVVVRGDQRHLAPSFDHGNAFGFQERDARRVNLLDDEARMERWVERGASRHFAGQPGLVDLALHALGLASEEAQSWWRDRLAAVQMEPIRSALAVVPDDILSVVGRSFVIKVLELNRRRLLDGNSRA